MKIEGTYRLVVARDVVWRALMNPKILARALPGCEKFETNPDGSYSAQMKVGVAAIKGTYQARVEILDVVPQEHFRMKVEGKGTGGFLRGEGTLALTEESGATQIAYAGDAQVGGVVASVGQRLMLAAARQIINQFFEAFRNQLPPG